MAFGKDKSHITTNGHSVVSVDNGSGYVDVGYVDNVMAKMTPQDESTTFGPITVGYDLSIEGDGRQTSGIEVSDWIDARAPLKFKVVGPDNKAEIIEPLISTSVEKSFNGKTGSKVAFKATYQGASLTTAKTFITSAAS